MWFVISEFAWNIHRLFCRHSPYKSNSRLHLANLHTKSFLSWSKSNNNLLLLYMKCSASCLMLVKDNPVLGLSFTQTCFKWVSIFSIIRGVTLCIIFGIHLLIFSIILRLIKFDCSSDKNQASIFSHINKKQGRIEQIMKLMMVKK